MVFVCPVIQIYELYVDFGIFLIVKIFNNPWKDFSLQCIFPSFLGGRAQAWGVCTSSINSPTPTSFSIFEATLMLQVLDSRAVLRYGRIPP